MSMLSCHTDFLTSNNALKILSNKLVASNFLLKTLIFIRYFVEDKFMAKKLNSMASVRERTIPTERPQFVGEVIANF
jgi:hypothetical protein